MIWYEIVKKITRLSDDELDDTFLKVSGYRHDEAGRTRAFRSVGYYGANPNLKSKRGVSLVASCRRRRKTLIVASDAFDSIFWTLCSYPKPDLAKVEEIIAELLAKRGLFRPSYFDVIALQIKGVEKELLEPGLTDRFKSSVVDAIPLDELDGLALAAALYLEAMAQMELELAVFLKKHVQRALYAFLNKWNFRDDTANALKAIVESRILRNRWNYPDLKAVAANVHGIGMVWPEGGAETLGHIRVAVRSRSTPAFIAFRAFIANETMASANTDSHLYPVLELTGKIKKIVESTDSILTEAEKEAFGKDYYKWFE